MNRQKKIAFLLLVFTALAIFVLAAVLSQVSLSDGEPVDLNRQRDMERAYNIDPLLGEKLVQAIRVFMLLMVAFMPVALIYLLFTKRGRKDLVVSLINAALLFFLLYALRTVVERNPVQATPTVPAQEVQPLVTESMPLLDDDDREFFAAEPPEWSIWMVSVVLALFLVAIVVFIYLRFFHRQEGTFRVIAEEAQQAIDEIQAGGDVRQIIIKCYFDMMDVVKKTRGIVRDQAMTPEEFESLLEKMGFPAGPLQRLTRLFEDVRYGTHDPRPQEDQLAVICLQEIVAACQKDKGAP